MSNSATIVNPVECVLLTVKQAAQALQVSEKTVWNLMAAGKLQYVRSHPGNYTVAGLGAELRS
jgi:excisionase family DNA binding protein